MELPVFTVRSDTVWLSNLVLVPALYTYYIDNPETGEESNSQDDDDLEGIGYENEDEG